MRTLTPVAVIVALRLRRYWQWHNIEARWAGIKSIGGERRNIRGGRVYLGRDDHGFGVSAVCVVASAKSSKLGAGAGIHVNNAPL